MSGPREPRTDRLTPPYLVRRGATHRVRRASRRSYHRGVPEPVPSPGPRVDEPLRRNHDFRVVLVSQGISALGDAVSFTALPLLVFGVPGGLRGGHAGPCRASDTTATALMGVALCVVALAFVPARALRSASAARLAAGPMPGQDVVLGA